MTIKEFKFQYALGSISKRRLERIADKSTSKYILTTLSKDKNWLVRLQVAQNLSAPLEVLAKLSKDKEWDVRDSVTRNPKWSDK